MRLTAEISVVCLSVCLSTYVRPEKIAASIRIRALILHLAGENLAASMRITRGSHYKDKSSRKMSNLRVTMDSTVTNVTDSEARRQEKLRRRRKRD